MKDLYSILGVERGADPEAIKRAYRKRSRETHPDLNPGSTGEEFREVQTAFDILGDPQKRKAYDEGGDVASARQGMTRLETMLRAGLMGFINRAKNGFEVDLLASLRQHVDAAISMKEGELDEAKRELANLESLRGRVKRKTDGVLNLFESAIEEVITNTRIQISACEWDIKDGREMRELLTDYESNGPAALTDGYQVRDSRRVVPPRQWSKGWRVI